MRKSTLSFSSSRKPSYHLQDGLLSEGQIVVASDAPPPEVKITVTEETKETPNYTKIYLKIAASYLDVALQAAFWQTVADLFDNYNDVYTNDSFYKSYSPSAYLLRGVCVGAAQGLVASLFSFAVDQDFKKSLKVGATSFASGFVWQSLADIVPLNTVASGAIEIVENSAIVGAGTAATIFISKIILQGKEIAVVSPSFGAVGFSLAYPIPVIEPKGIRGSLGGAICTAAGTALGHLATKFGVFCYDKASRCVKARSDSNLTESNKRLSK